MNQTPYTLDEDATERVRALLSPALFDLLGSAFASYADPHVRREASVHLTRQVLAAEQAWTDAERSADDFTAAVFTRLGDLDAPPPVEGWIVAVREVLDSLSLPVTSAPVTPSAPALAPSPVRRRTPEELAARDAERAAHRNAWRAANPPAREVVSLEDFTWVSPVMRAWYLDASKSEAWRARVLDAIRPLLAAGWSLEGLRAALDCFEVEEPPADLAAPVGWLGDVALPRLREMEPDTIPSGFCRYEYRPGGAGGT